MTSIERRVEVLEKKAGITTERPWRVFATEDEVTDADRASGDELVITGVPRAKHSHSTWNHEPALEVERPRRR